MNPPREGSRVLRRNRLRSVRRRNRPVLRAVFGASRKPAFSALLENGLQKGYSTGLTAWAALKRATGQERQQLVSIPRASRPGQR